MPEDISEFLLHVLPALRSELGHASTGFAQMTRAVRSNGKVESATVPGRLIREYERGLRHGADRLFITYEAAGLHESRRELMDRWLKLDSKGLDRLVLDDEGELRSRALELLEDGLASLEMLAGPEDGDEHPPQRGWLESMLARAAGVAEAQAGEQLDSDAAGRILASHIEAAFEDFADASRLRLPGELANLEVLGGVRGQRALVELVTVTDKAELATLATARMEATAATPKTRTWSRLYTVFYAHRSVATPRAWARQSSMFEWTPVISISPRATPRKTVKSSNGKKSKKKDKKSK